MVVIILMPMVLLCFDATEETWPSGGLSSVQRKLGKAVVASSLRLLGIDAALCSDYPSR